VTHAVPECAIDCRLFIQDQSVVKLFDRTTGALSIYTENVDLDGAEIEFAIKCSAVYAESAITW
jgi:hypothetical protein